jgi:hypothetical protein
MDARTLSQGLAGDPAGAVRARRRCLPGMWPTTQRDGSLPAGWPLVRPFLSHVAQWPRPHGALPDLVETAQMRHTRVVLAAAHLDHNPGDNRQRNLKSLCQRCHMFHDRPHHLMQRRITYLLRRALGDLFFGPYDRAAAACSR